MAAGWLTSSPVLARSQVMGSSMTSSLLVFVWFLFPDAIFLESFFVSFLFMYLECFLIYFSTLPRIVSRLCRCSYSLKLL
jgi:hypothetical protein